MKRIIQYWNADMPTDVKVLAETWKEMNPSFEYILFDHELATSFIQKNFSDDIFQSFKQLTIPAMICDVFRIAVILKLGGVYVDCGTKCYKPITQLNLDYGKCTFLRKWNGWIWNGWICADKENPVIKAIWNRISNVLLNRTEGNIWALTGPKVFMDIVNEFSLTKLNYVESEVNSEINSTVINIIDQKKISPIFSIVNDLQHKKISHWSNMQKIVPLFELKSNIIIPKQTFNKHIVIHIGQHKTNSTAIQKSLKKLSYNNGLVLYPKTGLNYSGHHKISDTFQEGRTKIEKMFNNLFDEITDSDADTVILSSEYFSSGNEVDFDKKRMDKIWKGLALLVKHFSSSEIIYYVSPQIHSIEGRIKQAIKSRLCMASINIKKFLDNPSLDYSLFDEVITNLFSESTITPRVVNSSQLCEEDIISDFNALTTNLVLPEVTTITDFEKRDEISRYLDINIMSLTVNEKMNEKIKIREEAGNAKSNSKFELLTEMQKTTIKKHYEKSNLLFFVKYPNLNSF